MALRQDMHAALENYTPPEKAVEALELMMRKISSSKNVPFDGNFTRTANGFGMPHVHLTRRRGFLDRNTPG
jgi:hypothetical protein